MKSVFLFLFWSMIVSNSFAQDKKAFVSKDSLYNANIKKSILYGVYIPRDIDDALEKLMEATTEEARKPLTKIDENTMAQKLHFGLGRWMEYNWNFDEGSRFAHYLRGKGLRYTEDMTRAMLILFHRFVCGKALDSDVLITQIVEERKKKVEAEKEKNLKTGQIIELNTKKQ